MLIPFVDTTVYSAGGGAGVVTFTDGPSFNSANQSSYSETISIGTASSDRIVIVDLAGKEANSGNALSITSVTIGGVAATVAQVAASGANDALLAIAYAAVPTGTTATLAVTLSDVASELKWAVRAVTGLASPTAYDSVSGSGTGVSGSISLNIPDAGVAACSAVWVFSSVGDNLTFTGITEEYNSDLQALQFGGASDDAMTVEASRTLTVTGPASANYKIIAVSWS